jgi:hypothetical protein
MSRLAIKDVNALLALNPRFVDFLAYEKATSAIKVRLEDVTVHPTALEARLKIVLSADPRDTILGSFVTRNGIGTNEGTHYTKTSGAFIFHPGDPISREIVIPLKGNNRVGYTVEVLLGTALAGASPGKAIGTIRFSTDTQAPPPSGYTLAFETNFIDGFEVTDTGKNVEGLPCWQSRLAHGRTQPANAELGLYSDPVLFPETNPFPLVDGKRVLRSEKLATPITWDGKPWNYTASVITSRALPQAQVRPGMRVEARFAMPVLGKRGAWPAFWMLPTSGAWPPEIDMMEWPINSAHNAWIYWSTQHWTPGHSSRGYPLDIRLLGATTDLTNFHTYGVEIDDEKIRFEFDGAKTAEMENRSPGQSWYVLLNMAMGGSWPGSPTAITEFPCDMVLEWIRFYEPTG